jgi:hypothetical protein
MPAKPIPAETPKRRSAEAPKKPAHPRPKLVRGSFTMTEADFDVIDALKSKALETKRVAKKSELVRAGLRSLAALDAKALAAALDQLEPVKTGRPKKGH